MNIRVPSSLLTDKPTRGQSHPWRPGRVNTNMLFLHTPLKFRRPSEFIVLISASLPNETFGQPAPSSHHTLSRLSLVNSSHSRHAVINEFRPFNTECRQHYKMLLFSARLAMNDFGTSASVLKRIREHFCSFANGAICFCSFGKLIGRGSVELITRQNISRNQSFPLRICEEGSIKWNRR